MHAVGPPEGPPLAMPGQQFYDEAGIWAAFLVQATLRGPRRLWAQVIDLSVHEVGLFNKLGTEQYGLAGHIKTRATNFGPPPGGIWQCRDGMRRHRRALGPPVGSLRRPARLAPTSCPIRSTATGSCGSSCSTCSRTSSLIAHGHTERTGVRVRGPGRRPALRADADAGPIRGRIRSRQRAASSSRRARRVRGRCPFRGGPFAPSPR